MNEELSVSHKGNKKLGDKISVYSRPVGDTCPNTCEFLDNGCYAERTERIYTNTRKAYLKNLRIADWQKLRAFLLEAKKKGNAVRLHQNGDFLKTTASGSKILDKKYIRDFTQAYKSIPNPPAVFFYTHIYKKEVSNLAKLGISVFASVGSAADHKAAKKAGFKKFAWSTTLRKGKDKNKVFEVETGEKVVTCWEQLGTKKTCSECMYCVKPNLGSIAFLNH
jgi:hypothetical protein